MSKVSTGIENNGKIEKKEFSGLRAFLWPIHNHELKKFIPLALIMCCILFDYTVFRNTKDTLILTSAGAGTINLVEVQWKNQVKLLFGDNKNAMNAFMGSYSAWTGVTTIIFAFLFGSNILRRLGWLFSAAFTPFVILGFGALFFLFIFSRDLTSHLVENPLLASAIVGAVVVIASKAAKYCLFDPTKEMAYIPLDQELKTKGKAAVDVIGGRLGKSGGAFVQTILLMAFATTDVIAIAPIASIVFVGMCIFWLVSVKALSKKLKVLDEGI